MPAHTVPPAHVSTLVIGGGAMGCSTLYHLARLGDRDAVLLERNQLTSGTTWHSAAQVRQLRSSRNLTRLIQYSAQLYATLGEETGQQTGWQRTGSLSIATNAERLTHIHRQAALARAYGVAAHAIDAAETQRLWPLMHTGDVIGAVYCPDDGRVNPSDLCMALAKGARAGGARIYEQTPVTGFLRRGSRVVGVRTVHGEVHAENTVICAGLWSRELAAEAGVAVPVQACEHFYLLTQPIDGVDRQLPTLSDHDAHLYIREDVGGLLVGCFEPLGKPIEAQRLGPEFAFALLDEDWDHFEPMLVNAMHRIPALHGARARTLLNGPESFTPDGSFILGESTLPGLYLGCGMNSVGIATAGGAGSALAQWLVDGKAPFHLGEVDPQRFHAVENTLEVLLARAPEVLGKHYEIAYPGRQWRSARNLRKSPVHACLVQGGAHLAQVFGWERAQYFDSDGEPALTFARPPWFDQVAVEVRAAHERAGLIDLSTFGKLRVAGPDAQPFLDRVCANDMCRSPGRVIYTAMLNAGGGYQSDLTALRLSDDEYLLYVGSGAVNRDLAWLRRHAERARVVIEDCTERAAVLGLVGPEAAAIVARLGAGQFNRLAYFTHGEGVIAGVRVRAARLSYVGEAGWELSCAARDAQRLYAALITEGAAPAGTYAMNAMRIEKRFAAMGHELDGDTTPHQAGMGFNVKQDRPFIGSDALARHRERPAATRLVSIVLEDLQAVPLGDEPVYRDAQLIGQVTSAAFGHRIGAPVALAYLECGAAADLEDEQVQLDIAGRMVAGRVRCRAVFDPDGVRMRATG